MNKYFRETVTAEQEYNGKTLTFDPDSSPEAWKHYGKWYSTYFSEFFNLLEPSFFCFFDFIHIKRKTESRYVKEPLEKYNRLVALSKNFEDFVIKDKEGNNLYRPMQRLGGDTNFNFNKKKYDKFLGIIEEGSKDRTEYKEKKKKLDSCHKMHHTLLNFSLMPVMGNLQKFKELGLYKGNKKRPYRCEEDYENLDRPDTLIYYLDDWFKNGELSELGDYIKNELKKENGAALEVFLSDFRNIYDFCEKVYSITDLTFVNSLIENGKKPIESHSDVMRYIGLAEQFWKIKECYFTTFENAFLQVAALFPNGGETYAREQLFEILSFSENDFEFILSECLKRGYITDCGNGVFTR